jgi:nucleoid-associated protein YgaU
MSRILYNHCPLVILVLAAGAIQPVQAQDEFSYRDLAPRASSESGPLIPQAAKKPAVRTLSLPTHTLPSRNISLSRTESFQVPSTPQADLLPIAQAQGSQAARIFNRNKRRVGMISGIFDRLKTEARVREERLRMAVAEKKRLQEEKLLRAQEERRRQQQARNQAMELARRESEARTRFEQEAARQQRQKQRQPQPQPQRVEVPPSIAQDSRLGGSGAMATSYVIQPGDSLIKIARKLYKDSQAWKQIAAANGMDRHSMIRVGDSLVIPRYKGRTVPMGRKERASAHTANEPVLDYSKFDYKLYNIQAGDTLSGIASKYYGDSQGYQLIEAYNSKVLARGLQAGDKLLIPVLRSQAHQERTKRLMDEGVF